MVMYDNEFKTKENKISTKDEIELQHIYLLSTLKFHPFFIIKFLIDSYHT